jgi:hypothetical protein
MTTRHKRLKLSAHRFREIQDDVLGLENLDMARLLGLKLDKRANAIRTVERFRNGEVPVPGTVSTLLWLAMGAEDLPPWWPSDLRERIQDTKKRPDPN